MSSCLVLQAKDKLYIGADTSSSVFIGEKLYRLNNNTKKLFLLDDNTVLYCAGNNSIANEVARYITSIYCRDDFSLTALKNWLIEKYPYKNKDKTIYDVEILIATFKNNRTIVYQMSQYKNYDIVSFEVSDAGVQIISAGIKNVECMSFAENELLNKSGVKSIFRTTFNNLSCNYIGGCLDLYEITKNGAVKIFDSERIDESGIQYANEICNGTSVSLNAEVLVSKLIMSENLWLENDSGNYKFDDSGFTATSGKNTIKIQPNNSGELFSIYKDSNKQFYINSDGDVEYAGTLRGATGIFSGLLKGGSIDIGNNSFSVDTDGIFSLAGGRLKFDGKSLSFAPDVTISWNQITDTDNVADKNDIPKDVNQLNDASGQKWSTTVGNNWIKTANVIAQNLTVCKGNFTNSFNVNIPYCTDFGEDCSFNIEGNESHVRIGYSSYYSNVFYGITIDENGIDINSPNQAKFGTDAIIINGETLTDLVSFDLSGYAQTKNSNIWSSSQTYNSQVTLNGDISAPGVKNRTSTAVANVRCQNGSNSWLAIASSSSKRYKHDIYDITDSRLSPNRLYDLPVRQYKYNLDYIDTSDQRYNIDVCGFIAEEMNKVYPIACEYNENGEPENWNERYIIPPMLALIQEQHLELEQLKQEIKELKE